jgi:metal-responsive CopG/Arc/MetJ family transcriptional regulator
MQNLITVSGSDEFMEELQYLCDLRSMNRSEAIRAAISAMYQQEVGTMELSASVSKRDKLLRAAAYIKQIALENGI